jgi:rhodanese-related sulfurtransferase
LAVLSCYGTTVLIGLLSLLGVSLALDEGAWAIAISVFAALAAIAIAASFRRHRIIGPTVIAALGLGLILWVMFGSYSRAVELAGFVLLISATLWDWRAGARTGAAVDEVSWIEPDSLAERLGRDPRPVVVDVRGADEFNGPLGHIANALNLPVGELPNRLTEINALKDAAVILVCRTDRRSANAAALLSGAGFLDARVLRGGMERWNQDGLPVEGRAAFGRT